MLGLVSGGRHRPSAPPNHAGLRGKSEGEGGLSADQILDQLQTQEGRVYDRGEVRLVRGMQQVPISLLDGDNHIPAGPYQVTLKVDDLEARIRLECDTELVVTEEGVKP